MTKHATPSKETPMNAWRVDYNDDGDVREVATYSAQRYTLEDLTSFYPGPDYTFTAVTRVQA